MLNINQEDIIQFRNTQLRLLDAFHKICIENNLEYWIDFGTLLGAVRHKGFIPWDDDVDVSMPQKDYDKFLEIAETKLPIDIFLQTTKTDKAYKHGFAKLRDCYSTFLEYDETEECKYHTGIYMDVFPSVLYPKIPKIIKKILTKVTLRSYENAVIKLNKVYFNYPLYIVCKFIWFILNLIKGDECGQIPEDNGYNFYIPISYLYPIKEITFEGRLYNAPNKFREYLTLIFNDYMTPPPIEKRKGHAKIIQVNRPCNHPRALKRYESKS